MAFQRLFLTQCIYDFCGQGNRTERATNRKHTADRLLKVTMDQEIRTRKTPSRRQEEGGGRFTSPSRQTIPGRKGNG